MNILFLTLIEINSIHERGIYQDLLRKFAKEGHNVTIITPLERRKKIATNLKINDGVSILQVKTFNNQKTNLVEKGIGTLAIEYQYLNAVKKYLQEVKFDLVLYSTPPITFYKVIDFIKKRDHAFSYLLLKDIFPQNAVDMKMIKEDGFLHRFFLKKEKKLYNVSDAIGCMSQANVDFLLKNHSEIEPRKVEINPNSIEPIAVLKNEEDKNKIRLKYQLPPDQKIFVYGGNLGKPQGLDFLLDCILNADNPKAFFLIIGSGTEYDRIFKWFQTNKPTNAKLLKGLPKNDYDLLLSTCDVGLVFLHKDFTIPNFPSRLLSYLEMKMPVISATDPNTDIGDVIEQYQCGYKVLSGDGVSIQKIITELCNDEEKFAMMKENAWQLLQKEYTVEKSYQLIANRFNSKNSNV